MCFWNKHLRLQKYFICQNDPSLNQDNITVCNCNGLDLSNAKRECLDSTIIAAKVIRLEALADIEQLLAKTDLKIIYRIRSKHRQ